jgi:hypothetical protein
MAACAVVAAVWPLFRASAAVNADRAANETAFYKARLEEIRRDLERGLPPLGEAESAPRGSRAPPHRGCVPALAGAGAAAVPARSPRRHGADRRRGERSPRPAAGLGRRARTRSRRRSPRSRRGSPPSLTTARAGRSSPRSTCGSHRYSDAAHASAEGAASAR